MFQSDVILILKEGPFYRSYYMLGFSFATQNENGKASEICADRDSARVQLSCEPITCNKRKVKFVLQCPVCDTVNKSKFVLQTKGRHFTNQKKPCHK